MTVPDPLPVPGRWPRGLSTAVIALAVAALGVIAYLMLWTTFMVYDDEGYVLYSLRAFAEHGHLYDQVYSQYGPFFYVFYRGLHTLGLEFTNTTGREIALVCWVGAAAVCGSLVWRQTRGSLVATIATLAGVFVHLWPMVSEPSHPGGFIALLTAIAAWIGANERWSANRRAVLIGAIGGMLALTKINIGVFLFASAGGWWLLSFRGGGRIHWARWLAAAGLTALPLLLMRSLWNETWVQMFIAVVAVGGVALVLVIPSSCRPEARWGELAAIILGALGIAGLTTGLVLGSGTTPAGLLDGVILGPLRHPTVYSGPFTWHPGTLLLVGVSVPLALWLLRQPFARRAPVIAVMRCILAAAYAAAANELIPIDSGPFALSYGIILAWVFVIPCREDDHTVGARGWLALMLLTQAMHAYPVAGSQIGWGTLLFIPLVVLGIHALAPLLKTTAVRVLVSAAVSVAAIMTCGRFANIGRTRLQQSEEMHVKGAEHLRPPVAFSNLIRMLVENSQVHADVLFTLPGMMSFNLWSGIEPPTIANATHWFNLLSRPEQDAIQRRLEASPRSAVIVQRGLYDFLIGQHVVTETPLLRWVLDNYSPVFRVASYEFWVRKGRTVVPVQSARIYQGVASAATRYKIELIVNLHDSPKIARVELQRLVGDTREPLLNWSDRDARFIVTPIAPDGRPLAASVERRLPFEAHGLTRIDIFTNRIPEGFTSADAVIYLRDPTGRRVGEGRFIE